MNGDLGAAPTAVANAALQQLHVLFKLLENIVTKTSDEIMGTIVTEVTLQVTYATLYLPVKPAGRSRKRPASMSKRDVEVL